MLSAVHTFLPRRLAAYLTRRGLPAYKSQVDAAVKRDDTAALVRALSTYRRAPRYKQSDPAWMRSFLRAARKAGRTQDVQFVADLALAGPVNSALYTELYKALVAEKDAARIERLLDKSASSDDPILVRATIDRWLAQVTPSDTMPISVRTSSILGLAACRAGLKEAPNPKHPIGVFRELVRLIQSSDGTSPEDFPGKVDELVFQRLAAALGPSVRGFWLVDAKFRIFLQDFQAADQSLRTWLSADPSAIAQIEGELHEVTVKLVATLHSRGSPPKVVHPLLLEEFAVPFQENLDEILAPWRSSFAYEILRGEEVARRALRRETPRKATDPIKLLVLSDNWNFLDEVIRGCELDGHFVVRTFDFLVAERMFQLRQRNSPVPLDAKEAGNAPASWSESLFADLIEWADTVFIEWFGLAAVWASRHLPPGKKVIVRLHSYEAFTTMPYTVNFGGLDNIVFVADHVRQFFEQQFGERLDGIERTVIPNLNDLETYTVRNDESRNFTLGLAGYNNKNKGPLIALKILHRLRQDDSRWKLQLIGHPWRADEELSAPERDYKTGFFEYLATSDLVNAVEFHPFTDRLDVWFQRVGVILSCSDREGTHETVLQGISAGCVPVIRDWPIVRRFGGARVQYQAFGEFVFDTVEEATALAREHSEPSHETRSSLRSRALAEFDRSVVFPRLKAVLSS